MLTLFLSSVFFMAAQNPTTLYEKFPVFPSCEVVELDALETCFYNQLKTKIFEQLILSISERLKINRDTGISINPEFVRKIVTRTINELKEDKLDEAKIRFEVIEKEFQALAIKPNYPTPFKTIPHSFCSPSCAARACMRGSVATGSQKYAQCDFSKPKIILEHLWVSFGIQNGVFFRKPALAT